KNGDLIADATGADYTPPDTLMPGVYTYTRKVNDQTCNIMPQASTGSWVLTVGEAPSVTLSAASATVCTGAEVTLTATATPAAAEYSFNGDNNWQAGSTTVVTVNNDTTFTVKARSVLGCESAEATTTVTAATIPVIPAAEPADQAGCSGASVTFTMTAQTGVTYTWYRFSGASLSAGNSYTTGTSGSYYAVARTGSGCTATSRTATATLSGTGGALNAAPTACGCAAGLIASPCSYCFYAAPAGTITVTSGCSLQVMTQNFASTVTCPSGWRNPTWSEMACIAGANASGAYIAEAVNYFTSDTGTCGYRCGTTNCNVSGTSTLTYIYKRSGSACACGAVNGNPHSKDSYICPGNCWIKKCVKNL
ncbi:MAG: hypothetical protein LBF19_02445, partial [Prevotellaceae bacterium]|nr:hypothetical protein [Prevotellaceae bacterium]